MNALAIHVASWLGMVPLAVLNGAIREKVYGPHMDELHAHQLATAIGSTVFFVYTLILHQLVPLPDDRTAWLVGACWLVLTMAFEFAMTMGLMRYTLAESLADYNLRRGRVWPLFLIWLALLPWVVRRLAF